MRKRLLLAALPLGVAALLPVAGAAAQAPAGDSVVGSLRDCLSGDTCAEETPADTIFAVDAHSGPAGENPTGQASYTQGLGRGRTQVTGTVVCLSVNGNVAVLGIVGRAVAPGLGVDIPASAIITVRDQGGEASRLDRFSPTLLFSNTPPYDPPTPDCSSAPAADGAANERGDLVVRDGAPPASRSQCKAGGWQTFGFANRRQCVAAARRQARQECLFVRAAVGRPAFRDQYGGGIHKRHAMRRCVSQRLND